jgi:hypothetical protein
MVAAKSRHYDGQEQLPGLVMMFPRSSSQGPERWQPYQLHPVRHLSLMTRLALLFTGFTSLFGWFFFGFGMLFVWMFGGTSYLHDLAFFSGELQTASGQITDVQKTRLEIYDNRVYRYFYHFEAGGRDYSGRSDGYSGRYSYGESAAIEYATHDPDHSRIAGMSLGLGGWPFLFALLFPLVGAGFIIAGLRKGLKGIGLLGRGNQADSRFVRREQTSTRINNRPVYSYLLEFNDHNDRTWQVSGRSHLRDRFAGETGSDTARAREPGIFEPLVYNPGDPVDALLLDDLPGSPRIHVDGRVSLAGAHNLAILLPALVMIGNLLWILHVLELL